MKKRSVTLLVVFCLVLALIPLTIGVIGTGSAAAPAPVEEVLYQSSNGQAVIDATYVANGYVKVKFNPGIDVKTKVIIKGPDAVKYTYNLNSKGNYETFPLTAGNGKYTVGVYKNVSGTSYSTMLSKEITVNMPDQFAPFLNPNQYVNYSADSKVIALAAELAGAETTELGKVEKIYHYIITNFTYDYDKAATVKSGYLPNVDTTLAEKKGICFDYAAVMSSMLRSQGVPTKLVVGYAGTQYHAWISVYTKENGWVESVVFFDGNTWKLMDPTYASSGYVEYANNAANYSQKYVY